MNCLYRLTCGQVLGKLITTIRQAKQCVFQHVHRMCVKSLVDKSAFESITDECPHLKNFCIVMEHILSHKLQGAYTLGEGL